MSVQQFPSCHVTVPALAYTHANDNVPPPYTLSDPRNESLQEYLTRSNSLARSYLTLQSLPPPPEYPPPLPSSLNANVNNRRPALPQIWIEPPITDDAMSFQSRHSIEVSSLRSCDTYAFESPLANAFHLLTQSRPIKQYALTPRFPALTGKEVSLRARFQKLLADFPYMHARPLKLVTNSGSLLEFKYSAIEDVDFEITFDASCYAEESVALGRIVRFGGFYSKRYDYRAVALLNVINMRMGQVLLLALDEDKGHIGMENPMFPPIILNVPLFAISPLLLNTYISPTVHLYKFFAFIRNLRCI